MWTSDYPSCPLDETPHQHYSQSHWPHRPHRSSFSQLLPHFHQPHPTASEPADLFWPDVCGVDGSNHENSLRKEKGVDENHNCGSSTICAGLVEIQFAQAIETSREEEDDALDEKAEIERNATAESVDSEHTGCCANNPESVAKPGKP
jgi:hypothetical protein